MAGNRPPKINLNALRAEKNLLEITSLSGQLTQKQRERLIKLRKAIERGVKAKQALTARVKKKN